MRRGRRDEESASNGSSTHWNTANDSNAVKKRRVFSSSYHNARPDVPNSYFNRNRSAAPNHSIASISSSAFNSLDIKSVPSLREIKERNFKHTDWPWNKIPQGYEHISVSVLKLFGVANIGMKLADLPPELENLKNVKPLANTNSWIYRKVGNYIWPDIISASNAVAEHRHALGYERPHIPTSDYESRSAIAGQSIEVLINPDALIVYANDIESVKARYKHDPRAYYPLKESIAVSFGLPVEPQSNDIRLFVSDAGNVSNSKSVIQILNAVPLSESVENLIEALVTKMCTKIGSKPERVWANSADPFKLGRIYVQLSDPALNIKLAAELGAQKICGRPLVTSITVLRE